MGLNPPSLTTTMNRLVLAATLLVVLLAAPPAARGQQPAVTPASCTVPLVTSFAPCFSYLTNNSTGGAGSGATPTRDCCRSLAALMNASAGCACLVLYGGGAPLGLLGLPAFNRTLAVNLPRACGSTAVPLQCQQGNDTSTSADTPPAAALGPAAADAPPQQLTPPASPEAPATPADPAATAPVSPGQVRPALLPSSARRRASARVVPEGAAAVLLLLAAGAALL